MTTSTESSEALTPPAVSRVIRLFEQYPDLRFPGVDAESLTRAAGEIEAHAEELDRLMTQLGEAKEALFLKQQQLLDRARQAHAYVNIYASGDPAGHAELLSELAEIQAELEPRAARGTAGRGAGSRSLGRKRKPRVDGLEAQDADESSADLASETEAPVELPSSAGVFEAVDQAASEGLAVDERRPSAGAEVAVSVRAGRSGTAVAVR